jgi:hypothetical protein
MSNDQTTTLELEIGPDTRVLVTTSRSSLSEEEQQKYLEFDTKDVFQGIDIDIDIESLLQCPILEFKITISIPGKSPVSAIHFTGEKMGGDTEYSSTILNIACCPRGSDDITDKKALGYEFINLLNKHIPGANIDTDKLLKEDGLERVELGGMSRVSKEHANFVRRTTSTNLPEDSHGIPLIQSIFIAVAFDSCMSNSDITNVEHLFNAADELLSKDLTVVTPIKDFLNAIIDGSFFEKQALQSGQGVDFLMGTSSEKV